MAYVGSHSLHLNRSGENDFQLNQLPQATLNQYGTQLQANVANPFYGKITTIGSPLSQPTIQRSHLLRQYPQYNGVSSFRKPGASSIYHAFTLRVERQFTRGLSYTFAYTAGKAEDNAASSVSYLGPSAQTYGDQYRPDKEFGLSAYDVSRILTSSAVYELPFGHGKAFGANLPKAVDLIAGGWQVNGIFNYSTGTPLVISGYRSGLQGRTQDESNLLQHCFHRTHPCVHDRHGASRHVGCKKPQLLQPGLLAGEEQSLRFRRAVQLPIPL